MVKVGQSYRFSYRLLKIATKLSNKTVEVFLVMGDVTLFVGILSVMAKIRAFGLQCLSLFALNFEEKFSKS